MKTLRNILVASVAVFGLGIGSALAGPLNIDTGASPLDLSFGEFDPFEFVTGAPCSDEFNCSFDTFDTSGNPFWALFGGSAGFGDVLEVDLLADVVGGSPFGYINIVLDDGSAFLIDLVEFGTDALFSSFEFYGVIDTFGSVAGDTYNDFIAIGTEVGLVLTGDGNSYFANLVAMPSSDVPEPGTLFLLGAGLAGLGLGRRRNKA